MAIKGSTAIDNSADILDSRDIIDRIGWLDNTEDEEEKAELAQLLALQEEAEGYCPDWKHGATLIRDNYFEEYAQELAEDIGAIDRNATWPMNCIDWKEAARLLQQDYTSVDFDGVEYWVR